MVTRSDIKFFQLISCLLNETFFFISTPSTILFGVFMKKVAVITGASGGLGQALAFEAFRKV
jgi:hypothetical protein